MNVTPSQLDRITQLSDQWSFLWDKRRFLWIAAEDSPDGEQIEESDLDVLLSRLPGSPGTESAELVAVAAALHRAPAPGAGAG